MSLSDRQIELVQSSHKQVAAMPDKVAELFYAHLFEIAPEVKPLFAHADMQRQGRKLMQTINTVANSLKSVGTIVPAVKQLGARHVEYGVTSDMYEVVGQALIWTLETGLGSAFTDEVRDAWVAVYVLISTAAIAGANDVLYDTEKI